MLIEEYSQQIELLMMMMMMRIREEERITIARFQMNYCSIMILMI